MHKEPIYKPPTWFSRWRTYPASIIGHIAWGSFGAALIPLGVAGGVAGGIYVGGITNVGEDAGASAGAIAGAICGAAWSWGWLCAGFVYQFGSGLRKHDTEGRVDTIGLDCVDYAIGWAAGIGLTTAAAVLACPLVLLA